MKKGKVSKIVLILGSALMFGVLPLVNVEAKEIVVKVGLIIDMTGPLGIDGQRNLQAWQWYEEYLNEEIGGLKDVNGNTVKLRMLYGDSGFTPTKTVSLYKKFKEEGAVAIYNVGSVEVAAIRSMCLQDKIPMPTNSGSLIYPLPSPCFGHWADYSACSVAIIDYVKQKWEKGTAPWTKKRPPALFFIGPEAYPSWEASITPEVMRYAKLQGVKVVGKFFIPLKPIDTKSQILAAKATGADFIYTGVVSSQVGAVMRDFYDLGLNGDPTNEEGKIEIMTMFPISELDIIKLVGGREEVLKGVIKVGGLVSHREDTPAVRLIKKYAKKHGVIDVGDNNHIPPWFAGMRTAKAIELALQEVPGDKLKVSYIWEGFFKIKDFDTGGISPDKLTFTEKDRLGIKRVRVDRIEGKERVLVNYVDYKMLAPIYTEEYAKAQGKKSIYSEESLKLLKLTVEEVGYNRIKE